jgi:hypothetical protein
MVSFLLESSVLFSKKFALKIGNYLWTAFKENLSLALKMLMLWKYSLKAINLFNSVISRLADENIMSHSLFSFCCCCNILKIKKIPLDSTFRWNGLAQNFSHFKNKSN